MERSSTEGPMTSRDSLLGPGATLLRLMGLWRPHGRIARVINPLLAGMALGSVVFMFTGVTLKLSVDTPEELEQLALCGLVDSMCIGFGVKTALFIAQGGTLRQTVRLLEDIRIQFCNGHSNKLTRRRYETRSRKIYHYCQMVALPAAIGWVLCPILSRMIARDDHQQQEAHLQLPVPFWLPDSFYESPTYEIMYAANSVCSVVSTECCLGIDIFFVHMMLMVAAELEVLNDNLAAMEHSNLQTMETEKERFISRYKINGEQQAILNSGQSFGERTLTENAADEWLHRELVKNVLHHQAILRSVDLLKSTMNVSIFSLLFVNMANLCCSLFVAAVLLQRDGDIWKAINALFSLPALLYETIIYCIYAHIMTDQSERLMNSAYSCDWVNSDARFKRSLLIFMTVTERPIEITVGKMCTLSKQMLLQVLNGTYGLLNMLYYMQSSK